MRNAILNTFMLVLISLLIISCHQIDQQKIETVELGTIFLKEPIGIKRTKEYLNVKIELPKNVVPSNNFSIFSYHKSTNEKIFCQLLNRSENLFNTEKLELLFPISIDANEQITLTLLLSGNQKPDSLSKVLVTGNGLDMVFENEYYSANLSKSDKSEAKNHNSGQIQTITIKDSNDVILERSGNRIHWAPNFREEGNPHYKTIGQWDSPAYNINIGPYCFLTNRSAKAPELSALKISANYCFYADKPFFVFESKMDFTKNATINLLRNDEMTMDSLFTHVAFERPNGVIVDLKFNERNKILKEFPIENDAPWLCFYHSKQKYAFGSIRLEYSNINKNNKISPTYNPYTKISDGAGGGKYWNRLLINNLDINVPKGSVYYEKNAYLVFKIKKKNKFKSIIETQKALKNPIQYSFQANAEIN